MGVANDAESILRMRVALHNRIPLLSKMTRTKDFVGFCYVSKCAVPQAVYLYKTILLNPRDEIDHLYSAAFSAVRII